MLLYASLSLSKQKHDKVNFGGPIHWKETLPHVSHVIIRYLYNIRRACKQVASKLPSNNS